METPHFPESKFRHYFNDSVYEPAEDTFILLDALEADLNDIRAQNPLICVEIGCGSGAVITSLRKALGRERLYLATDINPAALQCTSECIQTNLITENDDRCESVQLIQTNLADAFAERLNRSVDLLVFNPPYVPTHDDEFQNGIEATWAGGGDNGRRLAIDRFLSHTLSATLSAKGVAYLVAIEQNNIDHIISESNTLGYDCRRILTRKCGIEKLSVLRFTHRTK